MRLDLEGESLARIETTRALHRRLARECAAKGVTVEELAIAAVYSTFDQAEAHAGAEMAAIEWLRDAIDVLEAGIMNGHARRQDHHG